MAKILSAIYCGFYAVFVTIFMPDKAKSIIGEGKSRNVKGIEK